MAFDIPVHFVQQYTTNVEMLLQQQGGKLETTFTRGTYTGKSVKAVEQFGPIIPSRNLPRHADTPLANPSDDARWLAPADYDVGILIDRQDKLRMLIDPQSPYTMNMVEGMRRAADDECLQAFFANALTGENGTTVTNYPASANDIGVNVGGTASGLNVAKLREAKKQLLAAGVAVESDPLYIIVDAEAHDNLLNELQVVSLDYNNRPTLVDGYVKSFMGFNFIHVEFTSATDYPLVNASGLLTDTDQVLLPCWARSGMHFGEWQGMEIDVGPRRDKRNSQQIYMSKTCAATRLQEGKVRRIRVAR